MSKRRAPRRGEQPGPDGLVVELVDPGVDEKRLLVLESEFAKVLAVGGRKDSTLSAVLRDAWDRGDLNTLSKGSPECASGALISMLAQITPMELTARLDERESRPGSPPKNGP